MPLLDGVKMACASCIRGHRSQRCEHHERPLLKLRKKGRPTTSQCDVCRDLRKALGIHTRCICEHDASEAPKRKEMVKKIEVDRTLDHPEQRVSNDTTTLRATSPPHPQILRGSSSFAPLDASNPLGDGSSQTPRLNNAGASVVCTRGSESCCTRPSGSPDGTRNRQGKPPVESVHLTRPMDDSMIRPFQTKAHQYSPHLQDVRNPSSAYGGPFAMSEVSRNVHPRAQPPDPFDSETLELWDRFLGEENGTDEVSGVASVANMPNMFQESLSLPTPTDSCRLESCCESCIPDGNCCEMSALCIALGCFSLGAGMERIEDFPVAGDDDSMTIPPLSQSTTNQAEPDYSQVFSLLDSLHSDTLMTGIPDQSGVEAAAQGFTLTTPCICKDDCTCPICDARLAEDMLSWKFCEFCVACLFCVDSTASVQRTLQALAQ